MSLDNTMSSSPMWYVYFLRCADNSIYTGVTTDIKRRETEHNTNNKLGAKYTRVRRPVRLVYAESHPDRSSACQREFALKRLTKNKKEQLIETYQLDKSEQV